MPLRPLVLSGSGKLNDGAGNVGAPLDLTITLNLGASRVAGWPPPQPKKVRWTTRCALFSPSGCGTITTKLGRFRFPKRSPISLRRSNRKRIKSALIDWHDIYSSVRLPNIEAEIGLALVIIGMIPIYSFSTTRIAIAKPGMSTRWAIGILRRTICFHEVYTWSYIEDQKLFFLVTALVEGFLVQGVSAMWRKTAQYCGTDPAEKRRGGFTFNVHLRRADQMVAFLSSHELGV